MQKIPPPDVQNIDGSHTRYNEKPRPNCVLLRSHKINSAVWHGTSITVFLITVEGNYIATVRTAELKDTILAQLRREIEASGKEVLLEDN